MLTLSAPQAGAETCAEQPSVSAADWSNSSAGAWYTITPVTITPVAPPPHTPAGFNPVDPAAADAHDDSDSDTGLPRARRPGAGPREGMFQPASDEEDVKPRCKDYDVAIDWGAVNALCEDGVVPVEEVRDLLNMCKCHRVSLICVYVCINKQACCGLHSAFGL